MSSSTDAAEAGPVFLRMRENVRALGDTALKIMRHPDATPEMLWRIHTDYANVWKSYLETQQFLREKFPQRSMWGKRYPWNE